MDDVLRRFGEVPWQAPETSAPVDTAASLHGINKAIKDLGESELIAVALARNCRELQNWLGTD